MLLLLNAAVKPAWLLVENLVQDSMGHAAFGAYAALFQVAYIASPLLDLGTSMLITRQIAAGNADVKTALRTAWGLRLLLLALYLLMILVAGSVLGFAGSDLWRLLQLGLLQAALGALVFYRAVLQGRLRFVWDAVASVSITLLVGLTVVIYLIGNVAITQDGYIVLNVACTAAAALLFTLLYLQQGDSLRPSFNLSQIISYARQSLPLALMALALAANERANQIVLERLASAQANGIYNAAFRWFGAAAMYLWTIMPVFYARLAAADAAGQAQLLRVGTPIVALPMLWVGGFCMWHGSVLFGLYRHSNPAQLAEMSAHLQLLGGALALHAIFVLVGTHLTAQGKPEYVMAAAVPACIANIGVTAGLLQWLGPLAASAGMLASMCMLVAGYLVFHQGVLRLPLPWGAYRRLLAAFGVMTAAFSVSHYLALHWALSGALAGIVVAAVGFPPQVLGQAWQLIRAGLQQNGPPRGQS